MSTRRSGVTITEVVGVLAVLGVGAAIAGPIAIDARDRALIARDAMHIRIIHRGMLTWAAAGAERFPLPSRVDTSDATEFASDPGLKNRTGAVWSLMIFQNVVPGAEVFVSPAETNRAVVAIPDVLYDDVLPGSPKIPASVRPINVPNVNDPPNAVYDPSFKGTPFDEPLEGPSDVDVAFGGPDVISNNSYAHSPLFGNYLDRWSLFGGKPFHTLVSNRGPRFIDDFVAMQGDDWELREDQAGTGSNTLSFFGGPGGWSGNVLYADGRIDFDTDAIHNRRELTGDHGERFADNLFVSEGSPVEVFPEKRTDAYLRPFVEGVEFRRRMRTAELIDPRRGLIWVD